MCNPKSKGARLEEAPQGGYVVDWAQAPSCHYKMERPDSIVCACSRTIPQSVVEQMIRYGERTGGKPSFRVRCNGCGGDFIADIQEGDVRVR